jgi:sulfur-carrier protein adenylyltransferase/sulfurtransferase
MQQEARMSSGNFFKPVSSIDTLQLAELLAKKHPDDLTLLDVRQPREYAAGHLPGAKSIPLGELEQRLGELDARTTVVVYCAVGLRSRGAAALLGDAGFGRVYNLTGGLQAWQGRTALGGPEEILGLFTQATTAEEHVALAWLLEDGTGRFYRQVGEQLRDQAAVGLFRELAGAEDRHVATLAEVYAGLTGQRTREDFAQQALPAGAPAPGVWMEGGMRVAEAAAWAKARPLPDILELAIGLETNALDRYLVLHRELQDPDAQRVFEILADEERRHLRKLIQLFEHYL